MSDERIVVWFMKIGSKGCAGDITNSVKPEDQALYLGVGNTRMNEGVSPALDI